MARPSKYPESFRRDARRVKDPEQVAQAEQALETAAMRKRLAELEKENEILRKAARRRGRP